MINSFTWQMNLTVKNLHKNDFAPYICSSENALGKGEARIRLQGEMGNGNVRAWTIQVFSEIFSSLAHIARDFFILPHIPNL